VLTNEKLLAGEERLHCNAVYHRVRCRGGGSDYVLPLYDLSMRVGYKSGRFFVRMTELASYLNCHRNQLYLAAGLLEGSGFWVVQSHVRGKAVEYRPLSHEDWVATCGDGKCCKKAAMPWDGEEQDPLGKALYGVTGGCQFFPNVLKGWRENSGLTDEQILERAEEFMSTADAQKRHIEGDITARLSHQKGPTFRRQLGCYICNGELSKT
jgi:hypothetical protein